VDPLGGSYFVERLTSDLEHEALAIFERIDGMGGMVEAIERGYPQSEIAESAYAFQQAVEERGFTIVGVNDFVSGEEPPIPTLYIGEDAGRTQLARLEDVRRRRDAVAVERALQALDRAARSEENVMPALLDATRAYATVGEMCDALRAVWGEYVEQAVI
jgi:methylmalonyl-CoA mutase N-terminal domain/subunit